MPQFELELSVGETLQIGERIITILDTDDGECSVRLESVNDLSVLCGGVNDAHLLHVLDKQG